MLFSMFHRAFFNSIIDEHQHMHTLNIFVYFNEISILD